jgi:uncharacterized protein
MTLLDRHLAFLDALRAAGLPVSLSEGLDAVAGLSAVGWSSREVVRDVYAATLVKKQTWRPTFDQLFELYFPHAVGTPTAAETGVEADTASSDPSLPTPVSPDEVADSVLEAMAADDTDRLRALAAQAMVRLGAMPGRGPGLSSWSSYTALRRIDVSALVERLTEALQQQGWTEEEAERTARRRGEAFTGFVESDARRRIAEEKGPEHMAEVAVRPTIEAVSFLSMRSRDVEELRRGVYPLARRLAARLARQQHARHRGPVDMRRTLRASLASGGVPADLHYRPRRPHRPELVVLCDVSGSVASFAAFTLMLVNALQESFSKVRAFTFVDAVTEVTQEFVPGGDIADTMARLVERSAFAARMGRTNYGEAFRLFLRDHADALTPKASVLILGDARSNYSDLHEGALKEIVARSRRAYWLNPEVRSQWNTGDSEASRYGALVPMTECRNLTQLADFVGGIG